MLAAGDFDGSNPLHFDVSAQFYQITVWNLSVCFLLWMQATYQMLAFSGFTALLRYRYYVSRVHKLLLVMFVVCTALNVTRRLTPAAKFCSGDHLSFDDWRHKYAP